MIELSDEQREQLNSGNAVDVTDSASAQPYVLLRKDVYERIKNFLYDDSDWTQEELRGLLARASKENGWDDPSMDIYDRYDEELQKRRQ